MASKTKVPPGHNYPRGFGEFTLLELLGEGRTGEVHLALRPVEPSEARTQRLPIGRKEICVVKTVRSGSASDPGLLDRFLDETTAIRRLNHPNIVRMLDAGVLGKDYFLAFQFISGRNIKQIQTRANALGIVVPAGVIVHVISEALEALRYAHGQRDSRGATRLIHRDISPQNIMVGFDGHTRLTDFGLSVLFGEIDPTRPDLMLGNLRYKSPEMVRARVADPRSDLYAVGAILYELLSNEQFHRDVSDEDVGRAAMSNNHRPAGWDRLHRRWQKVLHKVLEDASVDRYPDATAFRKALLKAAMSDGVDLAYIHEQSRQFMHTIFGDEEVAERETIKNAGHIAETRSVLSESQVGNKEENTVQTSGSAVIRMQVCEAVRELVDASPAAASRWARSDRPVFDTLLDDEIDESLILQGCCAALSLPPVPQAWLSMPPPWTGKLDHERCESLGIVPVGPPSDRINLAFSMPEFVGEGDDWLPPHAKFLISSTGYTQVMRNAPASTEEPALIDSPSSDDTIKAGLEAPTSVQAIEQLGSGISLVSDQEESSNEEPTEQDSVAPAIDTDKTPFVASGDIESVTAPTDGPQPVSSDPDRSSGGASSVFALRPEAVRPAMNSGEFRRPKSGLFREVVSSPVNPPSLSPPSPEAPVTNAPKVIRGATIARMASLDPDIEPEAARPSPQRIVSVAGPPDVLRSVDARSVPIASPSAVTLLSKERLRSLALFAAGGVTVLALNSLFSSNGSGERHPVSPAPATLEPSPLPPLSPPVGAGATRKTTRRLDINERQRQHIQNAQRLDDNGAINELSLAIRLDPRTLEARDALLARARRYIAVKKADKAEEDIKRLMSRDDVIDIRESVKLLSNSIGSGASAP